MSRGAGAHGIHHAPLSHAILRRVLCLLALQNTSREVLCLQFPLVDAAEVKLLDARVLSHKTRFPISTRSPYRSLPIDVLAGTRKCLGHRPRPEPVARSRPRRVPREELAAQLTGGPSTPSGSTSSVLKGAGAAQPHRHGATQIFGRCLATHVRLHASCMGVPGELGS